MGLIETVTHLVAPGRGILAADESVATMSKRLEGAGVAPSPEARRDYRELLLTTPSLSDWVSGIILCEETLLQQAADGTPIPQLAHGLGVHPGIKVDKGVTPLPFADGAVVTEGLDGLRARLEEYRDRGATFAKWRAVLAPQNAPARAIQANAHALARYAALCQEAGLVPIVEPEVLMDGAHDLEVCAAVTAAALAAVFEEIDRSGVRPDAMVLKPNMVLCGSEYPHQTGPREVAERTLAVLRGQVPAEVPGIAFLSGGQSNERACANLHAINVLAGEQGGAPWQLTFSFGRALVNDALTTWKGAPGNRSAAQQALAGNCARAAASSVLRTETLAGA